MDEASIREYILTSFPDIGLTDANGDSYFFTDPEKMFPFVTLVTSDAHDQVSDLNRPGVYRLNIGVGKQTFSATCSARIGRIRGRGRVRLRSPGPRPASSGLRQDVLGLRAQSECGDVRDGEGAARRGI